MAPPQEKPAYKEWIAERDTLFKRGEEAVNRARVSSLGSSAAKFGKIRVDAQRAAESNQALGRGDADVDVRRKLAWSRVQEMEEKWNKRLMKGEAPPGNN